MRTGFATSTSVSRVFALCVHPTKPRTITQAAIQRGLSTRSSRLDNPRYGSRKNIFCGVSSERSPLYRVQRQNSFRTIAKRTVARPVLKAQTSFTSAICLPKLGHSFLMRNKNSQGRGGKFAQSFRSECHYDCAVPSGRNTSEMMHFSSTQAL